MISRPLANLYALLTVVATERPWWVSNAIYSEYDSCRNEESCIAHPYYPFNVTQNLSKLVKLDSRHIGRRDYEEMGISLVPRIDDNYDFYYRANYPPLESEIRFGRFTNYFSNKASTIPVPGIPADPKPREGKYWGPEDPRVFNDTQGNTLLIYSRRDKDNVRAMYIFNTVTKKEVRLSPLGERTQKNWTPITFTSATELVLYYSMQPVELVKCNIITGSCEIIRRQNQSFFPRGVVLRGGTVFYNYRGDYYYSFARSVDKLIGGSAKYRPVFMIIKFNKKTLQLDHVFVSSAFDFFGIPEKKVNSSLGRDNDYFRYILPYSVVVKEQDMILTLNVHDTANVILRLRDVMKNIDAIINQYETVDCDKQLASMGWIAVMLTRDAKLFRCQEKLKTIWRVAADDLLWNNSAACLATNATDSFLTPVMLSNVQQHKNDSNFELLNRSKKAIRPALAAEAVRLCNVKRNEYADWVKLDDKAKKQACVDKQKQADDIHQKLKCNVIDRDYYAQPPQLEPEIDIDSTADDPQPSPYTDFIKKHAGTILGAGALASVVAGGYLGQQDNMPQQTQQVVDEKVISPSLGHSTTMSSGKIFAIVAGIVVVIGLLFAIIISRGRAN